ncbi:MAG: response regulator transcription factor [Bacteroidetes bacterium]|nr:response regulator transcription factor [Bacteroidota bacterium]
MENLRILIVDDEVLIAEDLKDILRGFGQKEIYLAHSKSEAIKSLDTYKPDVALLDIRMEKEFDGLELSEYINANHKIPFIYITAHSDMAMIKEIVKTKPAAYITKPFKKTDLYASLNLVAVAVAESKKNNLVIKDGYNNVIIPFNEIAYIEGEGNYINIFMGAKKLVSRQSLDSVMEQMDATVFFRIHRSFIINMSKVSKYSKKEVDINGLKFPVSRNVADAFEELMRASHS